MLIRDEFRKKCGLLPRNEWVKNHSIWKDPISRINELVRLCGNPLDKSLLLARTGRTTELLLDALEAIYLGYPVTMLGTKPTHTEMLYKTLLDYAKKCDLDIDLVCISQTNIHAKVFKDY